MNKLLVVPAAVPWWSYVRPGRVGRDMLPQLTIQSPVGHPGEVVPPGEGGVHVLPTTSLGHQVGTVGSQLPQVVLLGHLGALLVQSLDQSEDNKNIDLAHFGYPLPTLLSGSRESHSEATILDTSPKEALGLRPLMEAWLSRKNRA